MVLDTKKVLFVIVLFIYIYIPPLLPVGTTVIFGLLFLLFCMVNIREIQYHMNIKNILNTVMIIMLLLMYSIFSNVFISRNILDVIRVLSCSIYLLVYTIPGMVCILFMACKFNYMKKDIWRMLIYAGTAQAVLGLFAYVFDPFQSILCHFLLNIMPAEDVIYWRDWRLYGLSCGMTYGMPITQALLGGLCFLYAREYSAKYYWLVPIIWLSGIINARVTLVVIIVEVMVWVLYKMKYYPSRYIKRETFFFLVGVFIFSGLLISMIINGSINLSRITDPIEEILSLLKGNIEFKTQGYMAYFFRDPKAFVLPKGIELIFGGGRINNVSDIGYIIYLWQGGITYSVMLYAFYLMLIKKWIRAYRINDPRNLLIPIIYGIVLFVVNIKGNAFDINEFQNLFFLALGLMLYTKGNLKKDISVKAGEERCQN